MRLRTDAHRPARPHLSAARQALGHQHTAQALAACLGRRHHTANGGLGKLGARVHHAQAGLELARGAVAQQVPCLPVGGIGVLVRALLKNEHPAAQGQRVVQGVHAQVIEAFAGPMHGGGHGSTRVFRPV
jgi:hypothetical protein